MQQYSNNQKLYAFKTGQEAWDIYYKSGVKPKCELKNIYCEKKENELWKEWNRGWNTNFKGIK